MRALVRIGGALALWGAAAAATAQTSLEIEALIQRSGLAGELGSVPGANPDLTQNAPKRYAIVIGNRDYASAPPLRNAINDAELVARFLRDQGFAVHEHHNVGKLQFEEILRSALFEVDKDTEVVFYYAGHGFQIGDSNYIVPVDAALEDAYGAPFETVSLQSLVSIIGARARAQVVILDSCRDNPFGPRSLFADITNRPSPSSTGFAPQTAPVNTLLAYSTSPGSVALDGTGENSPFTANLVRVAQENPGLTIGAVLELTRRALYRQTFGVQVSWESSTLIKPMHFDPKTVFEVARQENIPFAEDLATRSLALVAASLPAKAAEAAGSQAPKREVAVRARLEEEVLLGPALLPEVVAPGDTGVKLVTPPRLGRLEISRGAGLQQPVGFQPVAPDELPGLVYVANAAQRRAAELEGAVLTDSFALASDTGRNEIKVSLEPHPCDLQAGDYLDPDGVGIARYPNEIAPQEALLACTAAVAEQPGNGRFHYQLGRAQLALRDFEAARKSFLRARDLGHARAWYALGDLVANEAATSGGKTRERPPDRALALFAMGVKAGDPYAFYALGRELMRHETDIRRQREGYELMMRALEVGHTFAMNELGWFYLDEKNAFHDPARGLRYLRESARRNDIYGYNNLGLVYARGLGGVAKDVQVARDWFEKAAAGGHPNAPGNLGRMYARGEIGGMPDFARAVEWYDIGLERGDAWAGANAAFLIAEKGVKGLDLSDAALRAGKTAALRDREAAAYARKVLATLPATAIDRAAQRLMAQLGEEVAADGAFGPGSRAAAQRLAEAEGEAVPADPVERLVWLAKLYWKRSKFRVDLY